MAKRAEALPKLVLSDDELAQYRLRFASKLRYSIAARELLPELPLTDVFIIRQFGRLNN